MRQPQLTYPPGRWLTGLSAIVTRDAEIKREICERMAAGETLKSICKGEYMPNAATVWRWRKDPEFDRDFIHAMQLLAAQFADEVIEITDEATPEWAAVARLRADKRQWYAAKFYPKQFGDAPQVAIQNNIDNRTVVVTDEWRKQMQDRFKRLQETLPNKQESE